MTRVALDLLGGDHAPASVVDGALLAAQELPDAEVVLVGPVDVAERLLAERDAAGRLPVVPASEVVGMAEKPVSGVREKRDATVRVCAELVRDGAADAMVSVGSTGAALAAAQLTLGRLRGVTRPALAAVVPASAGPLVFLDIGATPDADADLLAQFALAGSAFATVRLGIPEPRVGLLTNGAEPGKGDAVRKAAYDVLAALPIRFVGNVEGRDVPMGAAADVVVTDGFTGNVLLKGMEGFAGLLTGLISAAMTATPQRAAAAAELKPALAEATATLSPDVLGGAVLLGVNGVCVVGHGASSPRAVAACVRVAVQAAREGLVTRVGDVLGRLLDSGAGAAT